MSKNELKEKRHFEVHSDICHVYVDLDQNKKIYSILIKERRNQVPYTWISFCFHSKNDLADSNICIEYYFAKMAKTDINVYKTMLESIKDSEPEYYKKGINLLECNIIEILEIVRKYSL